MPPAGTGPTIETPNWWRSVGSVRGALLRYRVMAYIISVLLIILVCVGVPLKYLTPTGTTSQHIGTWITMYLGITHGYLYMVFLVVAAMLARKARFPLGFAALVLVLGTIPFFSFWGERLATKRVRSEYDVAPTADRPGAAELTP